MTAPRVRLLELFGKVDAFFDRVAARYPGPDGVTCHAGCDACCRRRLSVTGIEADAIEAWVRSLPAEPLAELQRRIAASDPEACAALGIDGRCAIYPVRPLVCRSHGLPIRFDADGLDAIDACPLNFGDRALASLPSGDVLRQATVSTVLGALSAAHADASQRARGERVDLAELLSRLLTLE